LGTDYNDKNVIAFAISQLTAGRENIKAIDETHKISKKVLTYDSVYYIIAPEKAVRIL
jgi:hypothetical protein